MAFITPVVKAPFFLEGNTFLEMGVAAVEEKNNICST
jgi:hypothetical protein